MASAGQTTGNRPAAAAFLAAALVLIYVSFVLPRLLPGDFITAMYSSSHVVLSAEQEKQLRAELGSDTSFGRYLIRLFTLDWGYSRALQAPVSSIVLAALPWTVLLVAGSQAISFLLGFVMGVEGGWRRGSPVDRGLLGSMAVLEGIPEICTGVLLLAVFSYSLGWFPAAGAETAYTEMSFWGKLKDVAWHLALPMVTLTAAYVPGNYLLVRNSMVLTLGERFIVTAAAKGLTSRRIRYAHAARNALLPLVTRLGIRLAFVVTGAVVVETIFSYPGLGSQLYNAIEQRDLPLIRGIVLIASLLILSVNCALEYVYCLIDPRIGNVR